MTTDELITDILRREGWPEVTERASDRGGLTKGGITHQTANQYFGRKLTRQEFVTLVTEDVARNIYRKRYVERYDFIPNERLRTLLADYAVTSWHDDAVRGLQYGLGLPKELQDGIIGERTRRAVRMTQDFTVVYNRVWQHRMQKFFHEAYDKSVQAFLHNNPKTQLHNLHGWMNRLAEFL